MATSDKNFRAPLNFLHSQMRAREGIYTKFLKIFLFWSRPAIFEADLIFDNLSFLFIFEADLFEKCEADLIFNNLSFFILFLKPTCLKNVEILFGVGLA